MDKNIEEIEFTIFDTETTGLDPFSGDRIVEIAALKIKNKKRIASFQSLVNPQREISEAAFNVNHISPQMLENAPLAKEVIPKFLDFIKGSCLCSYNAGFDLEFLNREIEILKRPPLEDIVVADILRMAKKLMPGLERYALWFVAESLGIKEKQAHRALSDVELTLSVFYKFQEMLKNKGILDFANFSGLFALKATFLHEITSQKLAQIQEAINLGVKLKIRYLASSSAQVSEREVAPKEIRKEQNNYYLLGHCSLRNEERTFRVDNILKLEIL